MIVRSVISRIFQQEDLNFLLTNRVPRRLLTQLMGWFSQIEHPLVRDLSLGVWRLFAERKWVGFSTDRPSSSSHPLQAVRYTSRGFR
jgi:hypothetical protein